MLKKYGIFFLLGVFLLQSFPAWADHWDRGGHDRGFYGPRYGYVVHRLPPGYRSIGFHGLSYLYCEGLFYRYSPAGYVVVEPPLGAVVPVLPPAYTTVVVERRPYYLYGGTYYVAGPGGYVVAEPPAAASPVTAAPSPATVTSPSPLPAKTEFENDLDSYEIHIPNANGSYTLVTLKKTEKGFLGPQGEFYTDHPTVDQLKERYIKK